MRSWALMLSGEFGAGGTEYDLADGRLTITRHRANRKLIEKIELVILSERHAVREGATSC
jgi:acyl CoA:acetate/3-ketoacid CoA transferase